MSRDKKKAAVRVFNEGDDPSTFIEENIQNSPSLLKMRKEFKEHLTRDREPAEYSGGFASDFKKKKG